jgi:Fe-S-cluster containining protein
MSAPITRRVLAIYKEADAIVEQRMAATCIAPTCVKGCDACCHQLVALDFASAIALAVAIVASPAWKDRLPELRAKLRDAMQATADLDINDAAARGKYLQLRRPCVLLDETTRTCSVYDARPSPCRHYAVVSDPAHCHFDYTGLVSIVAIGSYIQPQVMLRNLAILEEADLPMLFGAMQTMLLTALDYVRRGDSAIVDLLRAQRPDVALAEDVIEQSTNRAQGGRR